MIKLQLGAFDQAFDGWINTDITPHLLLARIPGAVSLLHAAGVLKEVRFQQHRAGIFRRLQRLDARKPFPFAPNSIDAIYISHMLSNLTRTGAQKCLRECHRVLKPGGVLRIATLDLDAAVRSFDHATPDIFLDLLFDLDTSHRAKNRHWWHYNETSLGIALQTAGFPDSYRCAFRQGRCPDVERIDTRPLSLFMEAVK